ncbi:Sugar transport protein 1 [Cinnamomum micranthum f. kanehirae]|uniref:Sugar transport protein 1 n=1 Tax=Cinnamomum micranthum f. kanehirae TaxID=337451 RepID=A0A3S3NBW0_9MAGN|nr:Sugar transport protein 1 [Cinnamomum micranthum f. kanehirae]
MAGGAVVSSVLEKVYQWKMTLCALLPCIIATTGGLIFGYSRVSGGVTTMDPFLRKFYHSVYHNMKEHENDRKYCMFDSPMLTMFTSSLYLAALMASLFGSWMASKFGSKISMLIGGFVFLVGAGINGVAISVAMLIIGRILLRVCVGFQIQIHSYATDLNIAPTLLGRPSRQGYRTGRGLFRRWENAPTHQAVLLYLCEMAPTNYHGFFNILFQLMITIGILAANLVNYATYNIKGGWGWRVSLAGAAVPAAIDFQ